MDLDLDLQVDLDAVSDINKKITRVLRKVDLDVESVVKDLNGLMRSFYQNNLLDNVSSKKNNIRKEIKIKKQNKIRKKIVHNPRVIDTSSESE
jgi:hypothetical protein